LLLSLIEIESNSIAYLETRCFLSRKTPSQNYQDS